MLPKPGKSNYSSVRSYRAITLESVIGKTMEQVICNRLVWKLEVEGEVQKLSQPTVNRNNLCKLFLEYAIPSQRQGIRNKVQF